MDSIDRRYEQRTAKETVLDLFAAATGMPITLYEFPNGVGGEPDVTISGESRSRFADHCKRIQEHDGGACCRSDQIDRARAVFRSGKPQLLCCYAGLYNEVVPILDAENAPRAVVSYGEVQLQGDKYEERSLAKHRQAVGKLQLEVLQAEELGQLRLQAPRLTRQQFEGFRDVLRKTIHLLYTLIDQDEQMRRKADHLSHEIQTPIQDVLGKIDVLQTLWPALTMDDAQRQKVGLPAVTIDDLRARAKAAWDAAVRLRTVAQTLTLGAYLAEYRFEEVSLLPMLFEVRSLYEAEAANRGIEIEIWVKQDGEVPIIEGSREHLQLALNNLVHNALKYSFRGSESRRRFVRVEGRFVGEEYELTITNYGIGILPEEIQHGKIFSDGYQGKLRQGEYRTGSGKGLYFVKSIIEHHHGIIQVRSEPQSDEELGLDNKLPYLTRITVRLPRKQVPGGAVHAKDHRLGG